MRIGYQERFYRHSLIIRTFIYLKSMLIGRERTRASYTQIAILGFQSFRSFLKYLAVSNVSSLIRVSMVCFFPTLILGISTLDSRNALRSFIESLIWESLRYSLFLFSFSTRSRSL